MGKAGVGKLIFNNDYRRMDSSNSTVSVGIDVAKTKLDVALLRSDRSLERTLVENTPAGMLELISFLKQQRTAETVPCILESTGDYHLLPACTLAQAGFMVKVINPLLTKRYQRTSIRNAKSDQIDAERLATIGIMEKELPVFSAKTSAIVLRKLIAYVGKLEQVKQQFAQSTKQLCHTIAALGGAAIKLDHTTAALIEIDEQIAGLKKMIINLAPPEAKPFAETTPGLSTEQAAILLGALQDKQFENRDQLVAFVGLDLMVRQSGTWQGKQKLSKRGSPYLRKVLYQVAWGLKQHNPIFKKYYQRLYQEEGKHYTTVLMAVARKFLRYLYAYYWSKTLYPQPTI